ncbi:hypothetical protein PV326_001697, partial [Microctonus aethiopoides]
RDPEESKIQQILKLGTYLPLPLTAKPDGPRVVLVRGAIHDPKKFTFQDVLKIFFMIMDILVLEDDQLNIAGQDTILDLTGSRLQLASQFTPPVIMVHKEWTRKVIDRRDWFIKDSQYYVTESKRPGKQINEMQLFGCDGSFKQLEFD